MIKISSIKNEQGKLIGFFSSGHSGYAESGQDIICASVSVLTINTINSIEHFTSDKFDCHQNEEKAQIDFKIKGSPSHDSEVLLNAMFLGLKDIEETYGKRYVQVNHL